MKTTISLILCLVSLVAFTTAVDAAEKEKKKKKKKDTTGFTAPATPTPAPAPSVALAQFTKTNLEQILGPLDAKTPLPRTELAQLRTSFSSRFGKASLAERAQYQSAIAVCDAIGQAMDERNKVTVNKAADWPQRSAQLRQNIDQLIARQKTAEASAPAPSPGR